MRKIIAAALALMCPLGACSKPAERDNVGILTSVGGYAWPTAIRPHTGTRWRGAAFHSLRRSQDHNALGRQAV